MTTGAPPVRRLTDWDAGRLRRLAGSHGTPLYVIDLDRVRANCRRMAAAFDAADIYYAAKANTAGVVLDTVYNQGLGVECASIGEVQRALAAGLPPSKLLYTAVNPPAGDLDGAVEIPGLTITAGAQDTIDRLAERNYEGRLCIRVNPGVGAGHHDHVSTGDNPKFGVPYDRAATVVTDAADRGFDVVGIHAHAGSGITNEDLSAHRELVARMGALERSIPIALEFVDVGGGFGVPYHPNEPELDLAAVADATRDALGEIDARLIVEPGRYIVADAGVLLTRVNTVKEAGERTVVGVDAGMNTLLRPALYDAYHHIGHLGPDVDDRSTQPVMVAGPICESADVLGEHRELPRPERGDLLGVGNGGAYGFEMASQYNSRPRPAVVAIDGDTVDRIRRRETVEDITMGESEVQRT